MECENGVCSVKVYEDRKEEKEEEKKVESIADNELLNKDHRLFEEDESDTETETDTDTEISSVDFQDQFPDYQWSAFHQLLDSHNILCQAFVDLVKKDA